MDRLTEQDYVNAGRPIVRLVLENQHLRTALAHAKMQNDANDSILQEIAGIVHDIYTGPRPPTESEKRIARLFRIGCD